MRNTAPHETPSFAIRFARATARGEATVLREQRLCSMRNDSAA